VIKSLMILGLGAAAVTATALLLLPDDFRPEAINAIRAKVAAILGRAPDGRVLVKLPTVPLPVR